MQIIASFEVRVWQQILISLLTNPVENLVYLFVCVGPRKRVYCNL
jgi:hypothetical protein